MGKETKLLNTSEPSPTEVCTNSSTTTSTSGPKCRRRRRRSTVQQILTVSADATLLGIGLAGATIIEKYRASSNAPISTRPNLDGLMTRYLPRLSELATRLQIEIQEALCNTYPSRDIIVYISLQLDRLHIYKLLEDPPPLLFFVACTCLAFAVSSFQYRYGSERYHNRLMVAGGTIGFMLAALGPEDFVISAKGYLAWSIAVALLCSWYLHRILRFWAD